jgi:hypothetical protein
LQKGRAAEIAFCNTPAFLCSFLVDLGFTQRSRCTIFMSGRKRPVLTVSLPHHF